jgi:D-alanine transaminase
VRHIGEPEWRGADEVLLSNGLAGVTSVLTIDGAPVGHGTPGPMAARLRQAYTAQ